MATFVPQAYKIVIVLQFIAAISLIVSGCVSQQNGTITGLNISARQSQIITSATTSSEKYWMRIDPIKDFKTDSTFNITGSTQLNVKGTTNFPIGTPLRVAIIEDKDSRDLLRTTIEVIGNNSGPNTFSFVYDMKGNPPGQYRVILKNESHPISANSDFNITSDKPFNKWIRMNPVGEAQIGENIPVSGTTDLPAGSEITIRTIISYHSCTIPTPDREGQRSFCGGSCRGTGSEHTILVVEGEGGVNTWNSTVNTTDWCLNEEYRINVEAKTWTNVTRGGQSILT